MNQKTLVIIKPDGVKKNIIGEIINRFEKAGLVIKAMKYMQANTETVSLHYPENDEYMESLGKKSEKAGDKISNYIEHGRMIVKGLREYLTEGPVVVMVLEGDEAIAKVREVTGYTDPTTAEKGTIRGDFGEDSILEANRAGRPVRNLIHASGNPKEAEDEIKLWFPE